MKEATTKRHVIEEILKQCYEHFMRLSYATTSITIISENLERSKASIYHYFSSKKEMLLETCKRYKNSVLRYKMFIEGALTKKEFEELDEEEVGKSILLRQLAYNIILHEDLMLDRENWTLEKDKIYQLPKDFSLLDIQNALKKEASIESTNA